MSAFNGLVENIVKLLIIILKLNQITSSGADKISIYKYCQYTSTNKLMKLNLDIKTERQPSFRVTSRSSRSATARYHFILKTSVCDAYAV
jgi:hypothetical protein